MGKREKGNEETQRKERTKRKKDKWVKVVPNTSWCRGYALDLYLEDACFGYQLNCWLT
jgi:hypothetical protein